MDGDWEGDVGALMAVLLANVEATEQQRGYLGPLNWLGEKLLWRAHQKRANTLEGSRRNIEVRARGEERRAGKVEEGECGRCCCGWRIGRVLLRCRGAGRTLA